MLRLVAILSVMAAAAAAAQDSSPPAQRPLFSASSTELVVLPVAVTEGHDHFVAGLAQQSFSVYDNGRKQDIALFSNEDTPVAVGLIIDDSSSMGPKIGEVVAAALAFARSSNPADEIFAIAFNDSVHDVMGGRTIPAGDTDGLDAALTSLRPEGRTALYDAILSGLDHEATAAAPRKVLIVISDGGDNASSATLDAVLLRARQANVTIYTIGLFDGDDRDRNPGVLKKLAAETGGERFLPPSPGPLMTAVDHIAREIRSGYTLGYPPPDHDGAYHRIRVTVDAPDARHLTVRTRPGYFADHAHGTNR